jgi:FkbM family methyltransferase
MNLTIKRFLQRTLPKKGLQKFYENLYLFALAGMNYGNGHFKNSGELNTMHHLKKKLGDGKDITLFDVGGNIGDYSRQLALIFRNGTVHSFEPSKKTYDKFRETTSGIANIIANNFGMGDKVGSLELFSDVEASGLASVYHRNMAHMGIELDKKEEIELSTIDSYCEKNGVERIHFLKLDIEGHELKALKGAERMINAGKIEYIQIELGGSNIDSRTYFQDFFYLLKDQYRIFRIVGNGFVEIPNYKETYEVFITINYLAERIK